MANLYKKPIQVTDTKTGGGGATAMRTASNVACPLLRTRRPPRRC
jgi:hypothetical protein